MPIFLRVSLAGLTAFFLVSRLPISIIGSLLCWGIVIFAAYYYPKQISARIERMSSPVGYAVGMGLLMGTAINFGGVFLNFIWASFSAMLAASIAAHSADSNVQAGASVGTFISGINAFGSFLELFGAAFWGAFLGALGGLIGGSTMSRPITAPTTLPQAQTPSPE
jgi:hypothetical protein